jgi:hypothetical protein
MYIVQINYLIVHGQVMTKKTIALGLNSRVQLLHGCKVSSTSIVPKIVVQWTNLMVKENLQCVHLSLCKIKWQITLLVCTIKLFTTLVTYVSLALTFTKLKLWWPQGSILKISLAHNLHSRNLSYLKSNVVQL